MSAEAKAIYAPLPDTQRGKPFVLHADKKGEQLVYAHGKNIVVRNLANPLETYTYSGHAQPTTCAAFAPSGFYCCSGDVSGVVHIWDTTQPEHAKKYEYRPLAGAIRDIAWSEDSKRIVVVGEGRENFGQAFLWDSGSSVGTISGHAKAINSCDFKQTRPYRVATACEDNEVGFYQGPPFKLDHLNKEHSSFVNAVRFSPNGEYFVTGGADGKANLYAGKEGTFSGSLGGDEGAHKSGIYGVAWSPDSTKVITASADKTVKMWDVASNTLVKTFTFGDSLGYQQLGCLWAGDYILSVQLDGHINYLDEANPDKPSRILRGHNKNITALAAQPAGGRFFAASYDGRISSFDAASGDAVMYSNTPSSTVGQIRVAGDDLVIGCGDDSVCVSPAAGDALAARLSAESCPTGVANAGGSKTVVACLNELLVLEGGKQLSSVPAGFETSCASMMAGEGVVAVGGVDKKVHIYELSGDSLSETKVLEFREPVTDVAFSNDGALLAVADASRNIQVYDTTEYAMKVGGGKWRYHTAKVNCLAWCPDNQHLASGSLDTNVIVWNMANPFKRVTIKGAHPAASVTAVSWMDETTLFSGGNDSTVRSWTIAH